MGNFTKPKLNKSAEGKWFLWYNFNVPADLRHLYVRGSKRFKVYAGINRIPLSPTDFNEDIYLPDGTVKKAVYPVGTRRRAAEDILAELSLALKNGWLNPFEIVNQVIKEIAEENKVISRADMICKDVFPIFMQSRRERKLDSTSISAYRGTVDWLLTCIGEMPVGSIKYTDISTAINKVAIEPGRSWGGGQQRSTRSGTFRKPYLTGWPWKNTL